MKMENIKIILDQLTMKKHLAMLAAFTFCLMTTRSHANQLVDFNGSLMLAVTKTDKGTYVCSSVAYSRTRLITAAHCLANATNVRVFSNYEVEDDETTYPIRRFNIHPKYNRNRSFFLYDIATIDLQSPLPSSVRNYATRELQAGDNDLQRIGFGKRGDSNNRTLIDHLKVEEVDRDFFEAMDPLSVSGDSGGPIFKRVNNQLFLVGIHSTVEGDYSYNVKFTPEIEAWIRRY